MPHHDRAAVTGGAGYKKNHLATLSHRGKHFQQVSSIQASLFPDLATAIFFKAFISFARMI